MIHKLLKRQMKKCEVLDETMPSAKQWELFLSRTSRAYTEIDQERYLLERSLTISSSEMQKIYE